MTDETTNKPITFKELSMRAGVKISSVQWMWGLGCLAIFIWLTINGKIEAVVSMSVINFVLGFIFGKQKDDPTS